MSKKYKKRDFSKKNLRKAIKSLDKMSKDLTPREILRKHIDPPAKGYSQALEDLAEELK